VTGQPVDQWSTASAADSDIPDIVVVSGNATAEELAALTVVLMAVAARGTAESTEREADSDCIAATWHRLERISGFEGPRTWHAGVTARRRRVSSRGFPGSAKRPAAALISA
jgi:hypothetical protein